MGIREEIENLKYEEAFSEYQDGVNQTVADALSILDKWELVAEFPLDIELKTTKHLAGRFMDEETLIDIITDQGKLKLGDRLAIYRREYVPKTNNIS